MIRALNLIWIVPMIFAVGFIFGGLCAMGKICDDNSCNEDGGKSNANESTEVPKYQST